MRLYERLYTQKEEKTGSGSAVQEKKQDPDPPFKKK